MDKAPLPLVSKRVVNSTLVSNVFPSCPSLGNEGQEPTPNGAIKNSD